MQSLPGAFARQSACGSRQFSVSCSRTGHYQTLGIPRNATKNQIKASYYKLSKQFHPDVNKDPAAKGKFQAVSEAYAVLGDDRQRRAYDREQTVEYTSVHPHTHHEAQAQWSYEGRRRGATYAWEYSRRPNTGRYSPPPPPGASRFTHAQQQAQSGPNPFSNPNVQRATGRRGPLPTHKGPTDSDHVARESMLVRTVQVAALILLIASIGHGFSASAS
ncbi:DnaJ-domain-containing protein [Lentinus tigrinus ALCF2SS1-6]|uniref:DnaJ-domain-containing protein n=1 Tax=Lentinus tigrinus ALCF2SS1-6 TaxID=1328759 RepID=A0A5C2RVT6_9APHY|nr:DnaJ-domain-containing protein [Lentinus tigrinus ALCF2SS1-6]